SWPSPRNDPLSNYASRRRRRAISSSLLATLRACCLQIAKWPRQPREASATEAPLGIAEARRRVVPPPDPPSLLPHQPAQRCHPARALRNRARTKDLSRLRRSG